jgi:hypothetical protein
MTYGRNLAFRVPPLHGQRGGRYVLPSDADALPLGVPVVVPDGAVADAMDLLPVELATGAQAPVKGQCGLLLYEHAPAAYAGSDAALTTYSDVDMVPPGKAVQVISGDMVKVVLKNTVDRVFMQTRNYSGRVMVAGLGATPTLAVGDFLTPGTGDDDAGYWAETGTAANAWLVVERVDAARSEVEARFAF